MEVMGRELENMERTDLFLNQVMKLLGVVRRKLNNGVARLTSNKSAKSSQRWQER